VGLFLPRGGFGGAYGEEGAVALQISDYYPDQKALV